MFFFLVLDINHWGSILFRTFPFKNQNPSESWVLTQILLGKVKVERAIFDIKFRTKLLFIGFFILYTYSCRNVFQIFLNF